jgi:diguanylate cyclase
MFKSFRFQVALLFGTVAMVLVLAMSVMIDKLLTEHVAEDQGEALQALAQSTGAMLGDGLHERLREIDLLSRSPDLANSIDKARIDAVLDRVQRTRPQYSWIGLASPSGTVLSATGQMLIGKDVRTRPWFGQAQQGPFLGDVHEAKLLATLLPPSQTGEPLRFVDFAAPVKDQQGHLIGVLSAHANWDWVREVIDTLRSRRAKDKGVLIFILNKDGKVIHRPLGQDGLIEPQAGTPLPGDYGVMRWSDGVRYLTATAHPTHADPRIQLGWTIVVRQPETLALHAVSAVRRAMLPMSATAALLAMLLSWSMATRLSTPLKRIAQAARRIEQGELDAHLPQSEGSSELRDLSDSLRGMTESLQQHQRELEERVRERTAELQRANADLEILARKDGLTGLFNRRAAEDRMQEEASRHRRNEKPLCLVMADIDHFKHINDEFGHAAGDEALRAVAHYLDRHCRGTDFIARFGGEEFLLLLPETPLPGALQLTDKLRAGIAEMSVPGVGRVTISMGVAQSTQANRIPMADLLKAADEALYNAKAAGRNRVMAFDAAPEAEAALAAPVAANQSA